MWIAEVAHQMALVPLAFLVWRRLRGASVDGAWWALAFAFAVSWVADTVSDVLPAQAQWTVSLAYPIVQSAIVGAVLLPREFAIFLVAVLSSAAIAVGIWLGVNGPDGVFRSIAWLTVVAIVLVRRDLPSKLRVAFGVYFGLGWATWLIHVVWLVVATWYPYQGARALGLLLFCWAATAPVTRIQRLQ